MFRKLNVVLLIVFVLPLAISNQTFAQTKGVMPPYESVVWPEYSGKQMGVAVLTFEDGLSDTPEATWIDADSGTQVHFGLGDGLSNMLVSTLMSTDRFTITDKKIAKKPLYSRFITLRNENSTPDDFHCVSRGQNAGTFSDQSR